MIDEACTEVQDHADFHAVHVPARAALDLRAVRAREIGELQSVDLAGVGGELPAGPPSQPRLDNQRQRPRVGFHVGRRRGRDGGQSPLGSVMGTAQLRGNRSVGSVVACSIRPVIAIQRNAALAELGRVGRGGLLIRFHRGDPLRNLPSRRPWAMHWRGLARFRHRGAAPVAGAQAACYMACNVLSVPSPEGSA